MNTEGTSTEAPDLACTALVTGSSGCIGTAPVERLADSYDADSYDVNCDLTPDDSACDGLKVLRDKHADASLW